jgi:DNA-binding NtrC family response regulator
MMGKVLLVDDDKLLLDFMDEHLSMNGFQTAAFESPVEATKYLDKNEVDLVITDVKMNEMNGDEILAFIKENHPDTGVIMITGFGNIVHSVHSLRKGAYDYITKPFKAKDFLFRVEQYFETDADEIGPRKKVGKKRTDSTNGASKKQSKRVERLDDEEYDGEHQFIGNDPQVKKLMRILPQIARSDAPVMIQGESGTGKEVFAHQIFEESDRDQKPYVKINCANLPSELVESTLFGHLKGSFTGAIADRKGAFDEADGGTILLDEITEIDINVQAKLLRVLQEHEFYRIGSQKPIKVDVRVIATSNRKIAEAIQKGNFREDLFYRLNVFPISIPPLRKRKEDIPLLCNFFIKKFTNLYGLEEKKPSSELIDYLMQQQWPGNVRELNNKIHRGVILSQESDEIEPEHIDNNLFTYVEEELKNEEPDLDNLPLMSIQDMELRLIQKALNHTLGNQKKAAEILGISDRTIRNKLKAS